MSTAIWHTPERDAEILKGNIEHFSNLAACYLDNAQYFGSIGNEKSAAEYTELAEIEIWREACARNHLFDMGVEC